ncbi:MAG: hypothetical protein JNK74_11855 [Candidatus Hydrogenedentes bacterium]|nr:hypothetical protein [Candidatus Hydrogenedentota bacterium]
MPRRKNVLRFTLSFMALCAVATTAFALAGKIWRYDLTQVYQDYDHINDCRYRLQMANWAIREYQDNSSGEKYPTLSNVPGTLMFGDAAAIAEFDSTFLQYTSPVQTFMCPAPLREAPASLYDDTYYGYTGFILRNDQDVEAFAGAYAAQISAGGNFDVNYLMAASSYGDRIYRMREGVERFLITDINNAGASQAITSTIPVIWDWPNNHGEGWGGNVLYMDGHVEWVEYPGKFPMTEASMTILATLAGHTAPTAWNNNGPFADYPYASGAGGYISQARSKLYNLGNAILEFAYSDSGLFYPALSADPSKLMLRASEIYPEFTVDRNLVNSPGVEQPTPPPFFDDNDFVYLGYMLLNDDDVTHFAEAYNEELGAGGDFSSDLEHESSYGGQILRLRDGVQRFLITDINDPGGYYQLPQEIPIAIEWPDNYRGLSGGNVLYLDGHVEWHDYPGEFPMSESTITTLRELAQVPEKTAWAPDFGWSAPVGPDPYGAVRNCNRNIFSAGYATLRYAYGDYIQGLYPPLPAEPGRLMYGPELYPAELSDPRDLVCPGTGVEIPNPLFDDQHYAYLGYALMNDSDVQAFAAAYPALANGIGFGADIETPSSYGEAILRLREGVVNSFVIPPGTPLQEQITEYDVPVMIEWPGNHEGRTGGHVYYMDGHVEWHDYPGEFPMTTATITTLGAIAGWTPTTSWKQMNYFMENDPYNQVLCSNNLNAVSNMLRLHSYLSPSYRYTPLSGTPNNLMFDNESFITHHLDDLRRTNCPGSWAAYHQPSATDHSYMYLGYAVFDQPSLERFATAYPAALGAGGDFTVDLEANGQPVRRLRYGVAYEYDSDTLEPFPVVFGEQDIPVLIEWPDNHGNLRGGHVTYLDGSIEWIEYPGKFPMTEEAMEVLTELAGREPIRAEQPATAEPSRLDQLLNQGGVNSRR